MVRTFPVIAMVLTWVPTLSAQDTLPTNALTPEQQKALDMRLPELNRAALEPEERIPETVEEGERNPFGLLSVPAPEEAEEVTIKVETEEMKIRRILGNMRVAGVSGQPGSYRVLLGSMQLREGDTLPRLFANQAERLRVEEITDRRIVLAFIERSPQKDLPPRTIGLGVDLSPRVRSLLPGEVFTSIIPFDEKGAPALPPLATGSVDAIVEQIKTNNLTEGFTDHRRALLGEAITPARDDPSPADKDE
jgi:hypothetical protein